MRSLTFLFATAALAACSPYDPELGGIPYQCGDEEPQCPDGYTCQDDGTGKRLCMATGGVKVDGQSGGFQCANDSMLEGAGKNDTIMTAYSTPVATQRNDVSFADLAICPEGDKDTYLINVTVANSNLEVVSTWDGGMPVSVAILNGGGSSINNGVSNGTSSWRAYAANLPVGAYYAQASAAANAKNNYRLSIKIVP